MPKFRKNVYLRFTKKLFNFGFTYNFSKITGQRTQDLYDENARANALTHLRLTRTINHTAILLITRRRKGLTGRRGKKRVRTSAGVEGSARNIQNGMVSSANQDRWSIMAPTGWLVDQPKSNLPFGCRACTGWFKPPPPPPTPPPPPPPTILLDRG